MRMAIVVRALLALALPALAPRAAAAQEGYVFLDLPWGITVPEVDERLRAHGYARSANPVASPPDITYEAEGAFPTVAVISAEGRLVGVVQQMVGVEDSVWRVARDTRREAVVALGPPTGEEAGIVAWTDGATSYSLITGVRKLGGQAYLHIQFAGPGFDTEMELRGSAGAFAFEQLDPRWTVLETSSEFRTSFDRSTLRGQGGGVYQVWLREDLLAVRNEPVPYNSGLIHMEVDCRQSRYRQLARSYRLRGMPAPHPAMEPSAWEAVEPESSMERHLAAICAAAESR